MMSLYFWTINKQQIETAHLTFLRSYISATGNPAFDISNLLDKIQCTQMSRILCHYDILFVDHFFQIVYNVFYPKVNFEQLYFI